MRIFIASPLGFAESTKGFIARLEGILREKGYEPADPWSLCGDLEEEMRRAGAIRDFEARAAGMRRVSMAIARRNEETLRSCGGVLAVLDGPDADSGTASEVGYACALGGRIIHGYRGDFRQSGENPGVKINLQVEYWIEKSGGRVFSSLDELDGIHY